MVSFQCHKCSDVVKKPKLNQHHSFCHAPFDCIDCSTTFHSPTEYQGHTSCMTEAEKYQKSLYKGPRAGGGRGAAPRENWRGGFQGRGGYQGRPARYEATGANVTPLGTPQRMSPVTTPLEPEQPAVPTKLIEYQPPNSAPEAGDIKEKKKSKSESKKKDKKMPEHTLAFEPPAEKKDKKHKKPTDENVIAVELAGDLDIPVSAEISRKKSKKTEKSHAVIAEGKTLSSQMVTDEDNESPSKSKKRKRDDGIVDASAGEGCTKDKKQRKKEAKEKVGETPSNGALTEGKLKPKKLKRDKSEDSPENTTDVTPAERKKKPATDVEASPAHVDVEPMKNKKAKKERRGEEKRRDRSSKTCDKASDS